MSLGQINFGEKIDQEALRTGWLPQTVNSRFAVAKTPVYVLSSYGEVYAGNQRLTGWAFAEAKLVRVDTPSAGPATIQVEGTAILYASGAATAVDGLDPTQSAADWMAGGYIAFSRDTTPGDTRRVAWNWKEDRGEAIQFWKNDNEPTPINNPYDSSNPVPDAFIITKAPLIASASSAWSTVNVYSGDTGFYAVEFDPTVPTGWNLSIPRFAETRTIIIPFFECEPVAPPEEPGTNFAAPSHCRRLVWTTLQVPASENAPALSSLNFATINGTITGNVDPVTGDVTLALSTNPFIATAGSASSGISSTLNVSASIYLPNAVPNPGNIWGFGPLWFFNVLTYTIPPLLTVRFEKSILARARYGSVSAFRL